MPKPLVFVPGFPASELLRVSQGNQPIFPPALGDVVNANRKERLLRLLEGPDQPPGDIVAGEPIRSILKLGRLEIGKRAEALYELLRNQYGYTIHSGDNFRAVGWDWRKAVDAAAVQNDVRQRIVELSDSNGGAGVIVLVHSTGGLVLRRLLEQDPALAGRIEHILALGVPWAGTLASLQQVAVGSAIGFGPFSLSAGEVRRVIRRAQAAYDLFPPDPAKTNMSDPFGQPLDLFVDAKKKNGVRQQIGPNVDVRWMPSSAPFDFMRALAADADARLGARSNVLQLGGGQAAPPITNVVGWGAEMPTTCAIDANGDLAFEKTKESDGTVPAVSASWLRRGTDPFRTVFVPIGIYPTGQVPRFHSLIWDSPPLGQIFDEVLKDVPPAPYVCGSADSDEAIDPESDVTLRLVAADGSGQPLPNARYKIRDLSGGSKPFGNRVRLEVVVKKGNLHPNPQGFVRLVVEVVWGAGGSDERREIVILFRR
jgi:pimeloyl-ACP methyl ester carboxylesterase